MKTEVYSWRLSRELKTELEREARRRKTSLSAVLDLAVWEWLKKGGPDLDTEEEQRKLHQAASKCLGAFAGGDARRSERVRQIVAEDLRKRYGR